MSLFYFQVEACRLLLLWLDLSFDPVCRHTLGSFNGKSESSAPDQLSECSHSTGSTEEDSVKIVFSNPVVVEQASRVSIDVGPWIFCFSMLSEDIRSYFKNAADNFKDRVIREMFEGELSLGNISWVCFAENSMSIARDDFSCI